MSHFSNAYLCLWLTRVGCSWETKMGNMFNIIVPSCVDEFIFLWNSVNLHDVAVNIEAVKLSKRFQAIDDMHARWRYWRPASFTWRYRRYELHMKKDGGSVNRVKAWCLIQIKVAWWQSRCITTTLAWSWGRLHITKLSLYLKAKSAMRSHTTSSWIFFVTSPPIQGVIFLMLDLSATTCQRTPYPLPCFNFS